MDKTRVYFFSLSHFICVFSNLIFICVFSNLIFLALTDDKGNTKGYTFPVVATAVVVKNAKLTVVLVYYVKKEKRRCREGGG